MTTIDPAILERLTVVLARIEASLDESRDMLHDLKRDVRRERRRVGRLERVAWTALGFSVPSTALAIWGVLAS